MGKDVIIALDFAGAADTLSFLSKLNAQPYVKVGMELYYSCGPDIVRRLKDGGYKVFLDLKLHDIPNTVKSAMRVVAGLGADMVNLHAAGGSTMMRAAVEAARDCAAPPLVIAVTQLTSTSPEQLKNELLIGETMERTVISYAGNAKKSGLDGVVCSPLEAAAVHSACGAGFLTVTPGIRFADAAADDQTRVMTPEHARQAGSDYIVVGRPITRAADPAAAYRACVRGFCGREV